MILINIYQVNLPKVLSFLETKKHLISGCPEEERHTLSDRFVSALEAHRPDLLAEARKQQLEHEASRRGKRKCAFIDASTFHKQKHYHDGERPVMDVKRLSTQQMRAVATMQGFFALVSPLSNR